MKKSGLTSSRNPRQAQINSSREWIVGAYAQMIATMPDEKITISAICSKAGVGRQTFYRHFKNKKDVFTYQMNHGYELFCIKLERLPPESLTMEILLIEAFEFWQQHQTVLNPLAQSSDLNQWFMEMFARVWRRIARDFLPDSNFCQYDIEFQIAGINGVFLLWLKRDMKESPAAIAKMIVSLLDSHAFSRGT